MLKSIIKNMAFPTKSKTQKKCLPIQKKKENKKDTLCVINLLHKTLTHNNGLLDRRHLGYKKANNSFAKLVLFHLI